MLTKAILTGGVLSVLAGSIVYFGTEGADASIDDVRETVGVQEEMTRVEETALAGAADVAVGEVDDAADVSVAEVEEIKVESEVEVVEVDVDSGKPPAKEAKPQTKWLDQYLKKTKPEVKAKPKADSAETDDESLVETKKKKRIHIEKRIERDGAQDGAKGTYVVAEDRRVTTLDIDALDIEALDLDRDVNVDRIIEQLGVDGRENVEIRVIKKKLDGDALLSQPEMKKQAERSYSRVLAEAKKLLVTDMRNQAYLEIIDHAIDHGDMMQAADIVEELSTAELRDTARARIATGLARCGKSEAAFAVLDELEIDELAAPIRLEIITALMATRQERKNFALPR